MGKIVAAIGQSHIMFNQDGIEDQAATVFDGYKEVGQAVQAAKPDVIVIITGDHYFNVTTALEVPLAVSVGETHIPFGDMDVPKKPFKGHREFGEGFVHFAAERGFDLGKLHEEGFKPDHGVTLPVMFANPTGEIPTVVLNININMDPVTSPQRVYALGKALKDYVETVRPAGERVAVLGTGGLSHWLNVEHDGEINEAWDKEMLQLFAEGRGHELAETTNETITDVAGNGGLEILFWLAMVATVPGAKGREVFYEPIYHWKTGMGAVEMRV